MKRIPLPLSALLTGLLAMPGLGGAPALGRSPVAQQAPIVRAFPAQMPAALSEEMRRLARGQRPDAFGMQALQRRLAQDMHQRLAGILDNSRSHWVQVQTAPPAAPPAPASIILPAQTEKAAFLGVATSPAAPALREQFGLARGVGLVVDFIDKDSPAHLAGLAVHDILEKLDDQVLINAQQLAVLVRAKKPGDSVRLTLLRAGTRQIIEARLVEKEVAALDTMREPQAMTAMTPGAPLLSQGPEFQRLMNDVTRSVTGTSVRINADGSSLRHAVDDQHDITIRTSADGSETITVKDLAGRALYDGTAEGLAPADLPAELRAKINSARQLPATFRRSPDAAAGQVTSRSFVMTRKDDAHDITLRSTSGDRRLTVKETQGGKPLFDGPANTDEELKSLPDALREKVNALLEKAK